MSKYIFKIKWLVYPLGVKLDPSISALKLKMKFCFNLCTILASPIGNKMLK